MSSWMIYVIPAIGLLALGFALWRASWIRNQEYGTERMKELSGYIREGAQAFLSKEYRVLAIFVVVVAILLGFVYYQAAASGALATGGLSAGSMSLVAVSFIAGALCSGAAGYLGMMVATLANVRTTHAARSGLAPGLKVSFAGGTVMGMSVVGLAVLGLGLLAALYGQFFSAIDLTGQIGAKGDATYNSFKGFLTILTGFSMGASSIALFARVGGGIYTKAADVGGDLFGKVEYELPEDDPRNPASIADAVGDNVGDVAGMGADLFESYIGSIIGAMVLALPWAAQMGNLKAVFLPLLIAVVGIVISIFCTFLVSVDEEGDPSNALHFGTFTAAGVTAAATFVLVKWAFPVNGVTVNGTDFSQIGPFIAIVGGLIAGVLIGIVTEYYTSDHYSPVREISEESEMGTAPNIIAGVALGMWSSGIPVFLIVCAIGLSYYMAGLYGVGLAAVGMLSTTGIQLAVDAFGPIADNAGGIAEMAELPDEVRERTDTLDSVGNTTAAIGKGFAIGSAALTALALFTAYAQQAGLQAAGINILDPKVVIGIFVGSATTFVFSALTMQAVGRSASTMIEELRRQFDEIDGIKTGDTEPEYTKCIAISTESALKEMIAPGLLAIGVVVLTGYVFGPPGIANVLGPQMLGGVLAGVTASGVAMAIFMSNAGGAWDNAKKYIEAGHHGGDGSEAHKASVVGDTVGDPFKDTAGPSLNILLKLMTVTALVIAPLIGVQAGGSGGSKASASSNTEQAATASLDADATDSAETGDDESTSNN